MSILRDIPAALYYIRMGIYLTRYSRRIRSDGDGFDVRRFRYCRGRLAAGGPVNNNYYITQSSYPGEQRWPTQLAKWHENFRGGTRQRMLRSREARVYIKKKTHTHTYIYARARERVCMCAYLVYLLNWESLNETNETKKKRTKKKHRVLIVLLLQNRFRPHDLYI